MELLRSFLSKIMSLLRPPLIKPQKRTYSQEEIELLTRLGAFLKQEALKKQRRKQ